MKKDKNVEEFCDLDFQPKMVIAGISKMISGEIAVIKNRLTHFSADFSCGLKASINSAGAEYYGMGK
jgi:hypothetical protein